MSTHRFFMANGCWHCLADAVMASGLTQTEALKNWQRLAKADSTGGPPKAKSSLRPRKPPATQPLDAANNPAALLKLATVQEITGMSRSTIYARLAEGNFVQPIRRGARFTRWRAGEVMAYLDSLDSTP